MADRASETVSRLREAAESLLLEKGQQATTLRDITERASANVASVSYHFGSKDALLAEVFRSALDEVTELQRARLEALAADASLEDVVRVWLGPALQSTGRDAREAKLWALVQRGMTEQAPGLLPQLLAIRPVVEGQLMERLARHLPHLGREELLVRHAATLAATGALGSGLGALLDGVDPTLLADLIVTWVVGGLRAPATSPQQS